MSQKKSNLRGGISNILTIIIVVMLVISGPSQAIQVELNMENINDHQVGEENSFYINLTIGANEKIPITSVSVDGLPYIPGSPTGTLVFNVSEFSSVGEYRIKGNYRISLIDRNGWTGGYGYGYGYDKNYETSPYYGYGYGYQFYGYGYGNPDTGAQLKFKVTVDTEGAAPGRYDVVARVSTNNDVLFQGKASFSLSPDTTAPATLTDLHNITYAQSYISWTWTDPKNTDFAYVSILIDNVFLKNVSKGVQFYNATNLIPGIEHTISTRTVDTKGNVNPIWVNHTAATAPEIDTKPPEAIILFNISSGDIEVIGNENNVKITNKIIQNTDNRKRIIYTLTDSAENRLNMTIGINKYNAELRTEILDLSYTHGTDGINIIPPENEFKIKFAETGSKSILSQNIEVYDRFTVKADFIDKRNTTKIIIEEKNQPKKKITLPGLAILKLKTDMGALKFDIGSITPTPGTTCLGDITGDGIIDRDDFVLFAIAYNTQADNPNFNADADLNGDGKIDSNDFSMFGAIYGKSCNP